ncbi:MAG: hypothetical protein KatS3mg114_0696 [Planctomycetaceae bacterium]|nr:MAG: hypothetical protein KatS3mg114_0696 [Planctomycetaceae bacterium]
MHEEWFDVVDEHDRVLRQAPRSLVHAHRWLHRAVHVFVFNPQGRLFVQLRSPWKDEYPWRYTSSASGHVLAGEAYEQAAQRELQEELGLNLKLRFCHRFAAAPETSYEHTALYRVETWETPCCDPQEIVLGVFVDVDRLWQWMRMHPDDFTPCFRTVFSWFYLEGADQSQGGQEDLP